MLKFRKSAMKNGWEDKKTFPNFRIYFSSFLILKYEEILILIKNGLAQKWTNIFQFCKKIRIILDYSYHISKLKKGLGPPYLALTVYHYLVFVTLVQYSINAYTRSEYNKYVGQSTTSMYIKHYNMLAVT